MNIKNKPLKSSALMLVIGMLMFLPGCFKKKIKVLSTGYADTSVIPNGFRYNKSFAVAPCDTDGTQKNELQTKEVEKKVCVALEDQGYTISPLDTADYCLLFNYGCESDTQTQQVLKYIPGTTYTTSGNVNTTYGYWGGYNETTTSSGSYAFVPETYTFYTKSLSFFVYDAKQCLKIKTNKMPPQIWNGSAWNVDQNPNLRTCLDFLIIRLTDLLGQNTLKPSTTNMYIDDPDVEWLRENYAQ